MKLPKETTMAAVLPKKAARFFAIAAASTCLVMGFASTATAAPDPMAGMGTPVQEFEGVVIKIAPTIIESRPGATTQQVGSDVGSTAANVAGGAIAQAGGYGLLGSLGADIAGAVIRGATHHVENTASTHKGIRVIVQIESQYGGSRIVAVDQPGVVSDFKNGEKVLVDEFDTGVLRVESL